MSQESNIAEGADEFGVTGREASSKYSRSNGGADGEMDLLLLS